MVSECIDENLCMQCCAVDNALSSRVRNGTKTAATLSRLQIGRNIGKTLFAGCSPPELASIPVGVSDKVLCRSFTNSIPSFWSSCGDFGHIAEAWSAIPL